MAYTKTDWQERIADNKNWFMASGAVTGEVWLANTPSNITQEGTPFSVEHMNKIEDGIFRAHKAIDDHLEQEPFGYVIPFEFEPTALELAMWRCLPLSGQMVLISQYQRLCDRKYVGNAANATADWWYKTSDPEGAVRDVNGAYMRVLDRRGLFGRAAGQNSKYKMANDAPYDGGLIGEHISDAMQSFDGSFYTIAASTRGEGCFESSGLVAGQGVADHSGGSLNGYAILEYFWNGYNTPTAPENRPASISSYLCIKY